MTGSPRASLYAVFLAFSVSPKTANFWCLTRRRSARQNPRSAGNAALHFLTSSPQLTLRLGSIPAQNAGDSTFAPAFSLQFAVACLDLTWSRLAHISPTSWLWDHEIDGR